MEKAHLYFSKNLINIELCIESRFFTVRFPKIPLCKNLKQETFQKILKKVDRFSAKTKLLGLIEKVENLVEEMKQQQRQIRQSMLLQFFDLIRNFLRIISFLLVRPRARVRALSPPPVSLRPSCIALAGSRSRSC